MGLLHPRLPRYQLSYTSNKHAAVVVFRLLVRGVPAYCRMEPAQVVFPRQDSVRICEDTDVRACAPQGAVGVFQHYYAVVKDVTLNGLAVAETKLRGGPSARSLC